MLPAKFLKYLLVFFQCTFIGKWKLISPENEKIMENVFAVIFGRWSMAHSNLTVKTNC